MKKDKCNYCNKKTLVRMDFMRNDGTTVPTCTCKDHYVLGLSAQSSESRQENMKEQMINLQHFFTSAG